MEQSGYEQTDNTEHYGHLHGAPFEEGYEFCQEEACDRCGSEKHCCSNSDFAGVQSVMFHVKRQIVGNGFRCVGHHKIYGHDSEKQNEAT